MPSTPFRRSSRPYRGLALLATLALALPLGAGAAQADPAPPGITIAPGRTPTLPSVTTIDGLRIENSFVSGVGWVKPGDSYPSRVLLTNTGSAPVSDVRVTVPPVRGMSWSAARAASGTESLAGGVVRWTVPSVPAKATLALVLEATAATLAQEPTLVWRDISSIASVTVGSGTAQRLASHGPKVIPPSGGYETARYGDRPFPVVPVDYADFRHTASAAELDTTLNDPKNPGSTYNLYQENSYGQLYPHGTIGSLGVQSRPVADTDALRFSRINPATANTCTGLTSVDPSSGAPTPLYTQRIVDGWYQLPGQRAYYGSDQNGSAVVGSLAGVGALQSIDSGCGPAAKAAYDAAVVADPDIDYNNFDTDKDGVVDFFQVIYQGCGGNGASQLSVAAGCQEAPNDNIWPHSSSLEFSYTDPKTGLTGYISKDQSTNFQGQPLWYTDDSYTTKTTKDMGADLKVLVRVGPYNVNPESAVAAASVISHEYGHSLGLPDYYSTGSRETYGDFNLMATDKGHNMDVIAKKELGWIVPRVLKAGEQRPVKDWRDSKVDTGQIEWVTPDGTPYTLSATGGDYGIHNGEAYVASLPGRLLIDPAKIEQGASGKRVWYSQQGNDFGCPPTGGRNLDFAIPGIEKVKPGTPVTATFKSYFDIEWDYDYGFVLTGKPGDKGAYSYTSHPSKNGYTVPQTQNPNQNSCQAKYGNGLTGTPASYDAGTAPVDRLTGDYPDGPFVEDSYDISDLAGVQGGVLRLSYATDPGLARFGWMIDDLVIKAGDQVLFSSDFENDGGSQDPRVYPGGCKADLSTSGGVCTQGWTYVAAGTPSELEHAYLMEMRDRSGFDVDGRGESDRGPTQFTPGLLLTYTDEAHGYGNVGTDNPPAQSPLDAVPTPGSNAPNLDDATFGVRPTEAKAPSTVGGLTGSRGTPAMPRNTFTDAKATPHVDNYTEPARGKAKDAGASSQPWTFDYDCLSFTVDKMSGDTDNTADKFDLVGDVSFALGSGCGRFNYGNVVSRTAAAAPVGGELVTLATPERVLDSRDGTGTSRGAKSGAVVLDLTGKVPAGAKAAVLNVTVDKPSARGFVTVYPQGGGAPATSNVNFAAGQTQANEVVVGVPASGKVVVQVTNASANVVADLIGYTADAAATDAGSLVPLASPVRALDTRTRATGQRVTGEVPVTLPSAVPADAAAVLLNVTVTGPDAAGFAVVHPTGTPRPGTSNVNVRRGQTQANEVLTRIGSKGRVSVELVNTTASVVVDVVGYVAKASAQPAGKLVALALPQRAVDTRSGLGASRGAKRGAFTVARPAGVPAEATAVVLNVTSTRANRAGFLSVYPGGSARPATSNVNFRAGRNQANEVLTRLGADGTVTVFVGGTDTPASDVIVDVVGYLLP